METSEDLFKWAKDALSEGDNFLAYDLAEKIPDETENPSPQKLWIMALALARSGSLHRARELTEKLPDSDDIDIAGLKSRIYKDLALVERNPERQQAYFIEAAKLSLDIFQKKHSWYNGINAATCLRMAGHIDTAQKLVRDKVLPICKDETHKNMWLEATLGECYLLLSDFDNAANHYSCATTMALENGSFGDFGSTLRQLKMLSTSFPDGAATLWSRITLPSVCVFSGHSIDLDNCIISRPQDTLESIVQSEIDIAIKRQKIALGYASCTNKSDIIFLESVLSVGGNVWVVPPFPLETSIHQSIFATSEKWVERLRNVLANRHTKIVEPECDITGESDEIAYDFTNRYILGLAKLKSTMLNIPLYGLAVRNQVSSSSLENTTSAIQLWTETKLKYDIIKLEVGI